MEGREDSPRAATAASKPSSSSPGSSVLRFLLGGREPVGETTVEDGGGESKERCKRCYTPKVHLDSIFNKLA